MSSQSSTIQIINGPSRRQLEASFLYPDITKSVRFRVERSITQRAEPIDGWVAGLMPIRSAGDSLRWYVKLRVVEHQLHELGAPRHRYFCYNSNRKGWELSTDHPFCIAGEMAEH
jgi:hypothetical protein